MELIVPLFILWSIYVILKHIFSEEVRDWKYFKETPFDKPKHDQALYDHTFRDYLAKPKKNKSVDMEEFFKVKGPPKRPKSGSKHTSYQPTSSPIYEIPKHIHKPSTKPLVPEPAAIDDDDEVFIDIPSTNTFMSTEDKQAYLDSPKWQELRSKVLKRDNNRCVNCNSESNLNCHHITYNRLGNEKLNDLVILCQPCHSRLHEIANAIYKNGYDRTNNYPISLLNS